MSTEKFKITPLILFIFSVSVQLIIFDTHPVSIPIDGYAYIESTSWLRPHGYDLFLLLSGIKLFDNFSFAIFLQIIFVSLIPAIIFISLKQLTSFKISLIVSIFFFLYLHPSILSVQIMSESTYIFACSLILFLMIKYIVNPNIKTLMYLCLVIFLTNEIRPSIILIYLAIIPTLFYYCIISKRRPKKDLYTVLSIFLINFFIGSISVKISSPTFGPENDKTISLPLVGKHINFDKNSINMAPFWMLHYLPYLELYNNLTWNFDAVKPLSFDPNNGQKSKEFFETLQKNLDDKNLYNILSADRDFSGFLLKNNDEFKSISKDLKTSFIYDSLSDDKDQGHKWPQIIDWMYRNYGYQFTGEIMRGMIFETLKNNPSFFQDIFLPVFKRNILKKTAKDETYYSFIPDKFTDLNDYPKLLNHFPLSSKAYAAWVYNLDAAVGEDNYKLSDVNRYTPYDSEFRNDKPEYLGLFKTIFNKSEIFFSYEKKNNKFALMNFLAQNVNRIFISTIYIILPLLLFFSFFSKNLVISFSFCFTTLLIVGLLSFIIPDPRTFGMHMIFYSVPIAAGIEGLLFFIKKLK